MDEVVDRANGVGTKGFAPRPVLTLADRVRAWFDLVFVDHGLLRLCYCNRHRVDQRLWRSAQPTPGDLRREKRRGIRTVLCVRGGFPFRPWPLEQEACERFGLELYKVGIRGREAPYRNDLLALIDLFSSIEYPALVHCKSGADRSGFVAAVYLMAIEGRRADDAMRQLSLRFGHLRTSRAGILGEVIKAYRAEGEARGLDFRQWVATCYDRDAVTARFQPRPFPTAIVDQLLRREG
ncbi:tyrosine-protein phosphatase [Hyphomicrobium sp. B1]|uniref:phosphatase domain-containing protein n=1 Tax=Hyphomicrobium sp. B1 TaxID=3075651 RepID=UPI003C2B4CF2